MQTKNIIPAVILALGLAISGYFICYGLIQFKGERTVSVKGLAERDVKADQAFWNIRFVYSSDSLTELYNGTQAAQAKIKKFMTSKGFSADEIEVLPGSVTDNVSNAYSQPNVKAKRYVTDFGVTLTTKKIDKVKQASQETLELIEAGIVVNSSYVNYEYTKINEIKSQLLDEATANAKKAAESFAINSDDKLGKIKIASQGQISIIDSVGSNVSVNKTVRIVTSVTYILQ